MGPIGRELFLQSSRHLRKPGILSFHSSHTPRRDYPFSRLSGDFRDAIEVSVVVEHGQPMGFRSGRDNQILDRQSMLPSFRELPLHDDRSLKDILTKRNVEISKIPELPYPLMV